MSADPERLELRVLGPLEVRSEDGLLDLGPPRQRAVLALLALNANRVVARDALVDAVWGERAPKTAHNALQVAVHGLRKSLGRERVQTQGAGYRLAVDPGELDLERFEELLGRARAESAEEAAATLREALLLHRGTVLSDLGEAPFVASERARIEELRLAVVERRIEADLESGQAGELVPELESLVSEHPFRERFRAQLMLALYRAGRQADALERYREARTTLVDELGVEPSPELQELHAAILRQDPALAAHESERSGPGGRPPSSLPIPARPLIGRELELVALTAHLRAPGARLVTVTGPGGTGKTRLALEVATSLVREFPGGVHFVDLAPLRDHGLVAPTTALALGVRDADENTVVARISAAVGDRDTLIVLDNVEHVLDAAPFVAEVLSRTPHLRVLATSREPLRIAAEHAYRAPPLALPAPGTSALDAIARTEAVALFVARARTAEPEFTLSEDNAGAVVGICRALDGLPLALELAAPRIRILSPAALLERLSDRLAMLAGGARDLPGRQRTLRATIDWSYELLKPFEQALFVRLSVFAGGWTLDAAETVCGASIDALGSLVEKSLVRPDVGLGEAPRFSMLETVREYAIERLRESGDEPETRSRHATYFARLAERLEPDLNAAEALDEAAQEYDNVRTALEHAVSTADAAVALRLCALARFWYVRGDVAEGRAWIERALAQEGGPQDRRARSLYWAATLAWTSGDHEVAVARARESLTLARAVGEDHAELRALTALGLGYLGAGDLLESRRFHAESLALARKLGRDRDVALSLSNIADLDVVLGNQEQAETLARESLEISRRLGDAEGAGVALLVVAASLVERGRTVDAEPLIVESIECFRRVDFKDFLASALVALARTRMPSDARAAARLLGAARALRAPRGPAQFPWEDAWVRRALEDADGLLGAPRAEAEVEAGAFDPDRTIEEALARLG